MSKDAIPKNVTPRGGARGPSLVIALAILIVGSMMTTQLLASALSYQVALGQPIAKVFGVPFYQPLGWLKWFCEFRTIEHPVLDAAFATGACTIGATFILAAVVATLMRYLMTSL